MIEEQTNFEYRRICEEQVLTSMNLTDTKYCYEWRYYFETPNYPAKTMLFFKTPDKQPRSIGIINKAELLRLAQTTFFAYLFDIDKRETPINREEWRKIQIHNTLKELGIYAKKRWGLK